MEGGTDMGLDVTDFSAGYGSDMIVRNISFSIPSNTLTALIGPNGCGKTTLLKGLCRLIPHSGKAVLTSQCCKNLPEARRPFSDPGIPIDTENCSSREIARHISYIPQRSGIHIPLTVLDVVLMGFQPFLPLLASPGKKHTTDARTALAAVGMQDYASKNFQTLSEGQKQLCILARVLVQKTQLLLFDEPDSALDFPNRHKMLHTIRQIVYDQKKTALLILHDLGIALDYCDQLLVMKEGRLCGILHPQTDSEFVLSEKLSAIYGPVKVFRHYGHCFVLPASDGRT